MTFSIIIPAFNSIKYIGNCLDSIFSQRPSETEVILVDNGSVDSTPDFVRKRYPEAILIRNEKNAGSSQARNQGAAASKGKYIMFMDSDAYLKENFFTHLKDILDKLPLDICGIAPLILKAGSDKIFSCGLSISPIYRVRDIGAGRNKTEFNDPFPVDGPNSCCAIFRREALSKAWTERGCFDEDFFFLFEDTDLAIRLKEAGYRSLFMPELVCHHHGNGSNTSRQIRRYLCFRNRIYMIMKNIKKERILSFIFRSGVYDFFRILHFAATNRYFARFIKDLRKKNETAHHL